MNRTEILPIGTRVWGALGACAGIDRRAVYGDGTVTAHVPCGVCWAAFVGDGRLVTAEAYRTAGRTCTTAGHRPAGYVVALDDSPRPVVVSPDDPTVLAVPTTNRSAA